MNKKSLFLMGLTIVMTTGCSTILDVMDDVAAVSQPTSKYPSTNLNQPHGIGEFQINKLTESEFQKIVAQKGLKIESCDNVMCMLDEKGKTRVIKLAKSPEGQAKTPLEYKYGPQASTYALLNYKSSESQYSFTRAYAYFFKGKLVVMYSNNHPDSVFNELEKNYPSVKHTVQNTNANCKLNGEKTSRPQTLNYSDWFTPKDTVSIQLIRGKKVDFKTCEYKPYDFLKFYDRDQYLALEKYSLKNRLF